MPKIVDATERRELVVDAVFAVIESRGLESATLAAIAAEAGLSIGSVRHYFAGYDELLAFAANALTQRVGARLERHVPTASPQGELPRSQAIALVTDLLMEVLPMDATRRRESAVWLEFSVAARTRPSLAGLSEKLHAGLATVTRKVVERAIRVGDLDDDAVPVETERLHALLDGLTVHGVLTAPADFPELARDVVRTHLASWSENE